MIVAVEALHHFRTPLTPVLLDLAVLRDGSDDGNSRRIDRIERNAIRIRRFAEQYVDAVSLLEGHFELHQEVVDVAKMVRAQDPDAKSPQRVLVSGDPQRIEEAIGIMRGHAGDNHTLEVTREDGQVAVTVTATHPTSVQPQDLFTPFEHTVPGIDPGGIGLSLSQLICRQMNGDLDATSVNGCISMRLTLKEVESS